MVLAGGSGTRLGTDQNKVYLDLGGRPMLAWSLLTLDAHPAVARVVVAVRPGDEPSVAAAIPAGLATPLDQVHGGATRSASELSALEHLSPDIEAGSIDLVVIHDGARPFLDGPLVDRVISAATRHGGAIPGLSPAQAIYTLDRDQTTAKALPTETLRRVQTPQAFRARPLLDAYRAAAMSGFEGVDTAEVVARFGGIDAVVVEGESDNLKVTTPADLAVARRIAENRPPVGPAGYGEAP